MKARVLSGKADLVVLAIASGHRANALGGVAKAHELGYYKFSLDVYGITDPKILMSSLLSKGQYAGL